MKKNLRLFGEKGILKMTDSFTDERELLWKRFYDSFDEKGI